MIDDDECGEFGGMRIGRGSRSTRRKPTEDVPAVTKSCWRLRFICSPCRIKGKKAISFFPELLVFFVLCVHCVKYVVMERERQVCQGKQNRKSCDTLNG
jgi:hypothetical protein